MTVTKFFTFIWRLAFIGAIMMFLKAHKMENCDAQTYMYASIFPLLVVAALAHACTDPMIRAAFLVRILIKLFFGGGFVALIGFLICAGFMMHKMNTMEQGHWEDRQTDPWPHHTWVVDKPAS